MFQPILIEEITANFSSRHSKQPIPAKQKLILAHYISTIESKRSVASVPYLPMPFVLDILNKNYCDNGKLADMSPVNLFFFPEKSLHFKLNKM